MTVNGIGGQSFEETIMEHKSTPKDSGNEFYKSLSDTMDEKEEVETRNKASEPEKSNDNVDSKWDEALLQFHNFVEDRVKNGAPKYKVGGSELSIEEWKHLLKKIDGNLDDIKDQLGVRNEKMKESQVNDKVDKISEKSILELLIDKDGNNIPIQPFKNGKLLQKA